MVLEEVRKYFDEGNYSFAFKLCDELEGNQTVSKELLFYKAASMILMGNYEDGHKILEDTNFEDLEDEKYYYLAYAYKGMYRYEKALEHIQIYLEKKPQEEKGVWLKEIIEKVLKDRSD
mgnify:CR=1 FL=1